MTGDSAEPTDVGYPFLEPSGLSTYLIWEMTMTLVWNEGDVSKAKTLSIASCAEPYHCLGSLAVGFIPLAQSNAASDRKVRESITRITSGPQSAGLPRSMSSYFQWSSIFRASTKALGLAIFGPVAEAS